MSKPSVSACLIVRDEEQNLALCLEALAPWVDELCVLDTGSRDATVAIAARHGAVVGHFEWCEDFAAARNACLELASSDWILSVDADELLDPESAVCLPQLLADEQTQAWLVWLDNLVEAPVQGAPPLVHSVGIPRLFRRRPELRYSRRVHESIMDSLIELRAPAPEPSGLRLVHSGYLPQVVRARKKRERNLAILRAEFERDPRDAFNAFKLSSTFISLEREDEALGVLRDLWPHVNSLSAGKRAQLPFLPLVAYDLARLEQRVGELERARRACDEALLDSPHVSELLYQRAELARRFGDYEDAREGFARARMARAWTDLFSGDPETRGVKPLLGLAKVAAMSGDSSLARDAVREARELLPQQLEARTLEARLYAVAGDEQRAWAALGELLEEAPGNGHVALLAAEMAWAKGERATAEGFWRGALASAETRSSARAWLAVLQLVAGELEPEQRDFPACDLPEAAARLVLACISGEEFEPQPGFDRARLLEEVHAWLAELVRDPKHLALHAFRAGAARWEATCPGIGRLLEPS